MNHLLCFGFGFSAEALGRILDPPAWRITGTSTTAAGAERIRSFGHEGLVFDGRTAGAGVRDALASATHVLNSVPPDDAGDPVLHHHGEAIAAGPAVWIGCFSTIGVYGDCQGAWIDETAPLKPISERGRRRVAAEEGWRAIGAHSGKRVQVFRLPGIYGPGRSAIDTVRSGDARRIIKPGQVFNRIHVDDIAAAVHAAMSGKGGHDAYNVVDDEPAPPQDVIEHAARLLGLPVPPGIPFDAASMSPMGRSFYAESKRASNARLKADLLPCLRHPTYREGLAAILQLEAGAR